MTKFNLIIKNADGSIYWTENFNSKRELNGWLNEEKTRPYWKKEFTTEIIDNSDAIKAQEEAVAEQTTEGTQEEVQAVVEAPKKAGRPAKGK
jgi:hypothetical protein